MSHPYEHIKKIAAAHPDYQFSFRYYKYEKHKYGSFTNDLETARFEGSQIVSGAAGAWIKKCPRDAEVAMDSVIVSPLEAQYFIPMLDLVTKDEADLARFIDDDACDLFDSTGVPYPGEFAFYNSGNSFHVYGSRPMQLRYRLPFLGAALLLTQDDEDPIVDKRWIGHALVRGCEALRLTANRGDKKMPKKADFNVKNESPF